MSTRISHGYMCTYVPHPEPPSNLPPHPIPQGRPRAPALSTLSHSLNLDWRSVSHMIIYMFQCYSWLLCVQLSIFLWWIDNFMTLFLVLLTFLYPCWLLAPRLPALESLHLSPLGQWRGWWGPPWPVSLDPDSMSQLVISSLWLTTSLHRD